MGAVRLKDTSGKGLCVTDTNIDIAALEATEARLAYLASFPEKNPNPIVETDLEGRVRYANRAALDLFPDICEIGGAHPWLAGWETLARSIREEGATTNVRVVTVGDRSFLQTLYAPAEELVRVYGIDITERQRAKEALRIGEERLAAIIDSAMDAIITVDEQQRVVLFNAAAERTFRCLAAEIIGQPLDRLLPERHRESHRRHIRAFGTTGMTARSMMSPQTIYGQRATGEEFPAEATISQATISGHKLYTVILRDITERKQAEELARLYAQTKELDRLKTEFFANISHELRTPLALIAGPVRKRLAAGGLTAEERRDLEVVDRNARLLLRHLNHLLDLSKLDVGRMTAEYAEVDLARLARVVASNFEGAADDRGVRYTIDVPDSLMAEVDPPKIERVLLNLLSNAFKFTPPGGSVRFTVRPIGDHAMLEVTDSGPGIPLPLREAIFERFRQIENGSNRRFGGSGLGLSIVKEFVSLHRGRVTVGEPPGGQGSVFRVEIPLRAPTGSDVQQTAEEPDVEAAAQTVEELAVRIPHRPPTETDAAAGAPVILLVEDNPDMNAFIAGTLSPAYRVVSAFDGQEGLDRALALHPELILCDVMMPRMSGDQMVREVRRHPELDDVPIVLLTAKADDGLRVALLKEGAQDYLHKPVETDELLAKVGRLIADRQRAAEELQRTHQLSGHLIEARDRERKRIADELHENVAQCLAALGWSLSRARKVPSPDAQRILGDGLTLLERASADLRALSYVLHPPLLDDIGLSAVIEWYVAGFTERSGIEVTVEIEHDSPRLPAEVELALFRIIEETLTNVRRHSGSKTVSLRVRRDECEVVLEVSDQGCGMAALRPEADGPGHASAGIAEMHERARSLGGRLEVASGSYGTTVRAVLPVIARTSAAPVSDDSKLMRSPAHVVRDGPVDG